MAKNKEKMDKKQEKEVLQNQVIKLEKMVDLKNKGKMNNKIN